VTSQATHKCNTVEWTVYTIVAESGSLLFLARKINLNPPVPNVNPSSCRVFICSLFNYDVKTFRLYSIKLLYYTE